ncbi:hypothetical protein SAMN03080615_01564 [Amphritea atlantica]|uniref:Immunity protein Imm1 n=1 Tax=Amphritea atlantica TaxID=355243 RepID=A0A1H9GA37_9GAMM|nr:hypothetical protein [Amphritea atlantica]SEQ46920.1 hypothetical protein SAMN03080615_01564 [Amphritea atlantica]
MNTILGGYILDADSVRQQLPAVFDPNYSTIMNVLSSLKEANGVIGLRCQPEPEAGPYELMLYSDDGNFLLMLNEFDEDGDSSVRSINKSGSDSSLISILGDLYSAKSITRDFQLVCSIFKAFAATGNVSELLMN